MTLLEALLLLCGLLFIVLGFLALVGPLTFVQFFSFFELFKGESAMFPGLTESGTDPSHKRSKSEKKNAWIIIFTGIIVTVFSIILALT